MNLPKTYDPSQYENEISALWERSGAFEPKNRGGDGTFSIILPPPNATGKLHVGHAAMLAIEDTMMRYQRMLGKEVVWIPGTDHAAIATENYVIEALKKEKGMDDPRAELGRDGVINLIKKFVANSQDTIREQIKAMGASVDWSRERYTMEEAMNNIVQKVFVNMYEDGLIYRGGRIINWDPNLQTTVSDDEIEYEEEKTQFFTFKYGPFEIGTARPETKFGDKYVVMHPDDERYKQHKHGDTFECDWINGKIKATIIKDEAVDPAFGTGVMTITPWHDATDYDIAERHKLDKEQIIDFDGTLMDIAGDFAGMSISKARPKIVELLEDKGLLVSVDDDYVHNVAVNYRGKGIIEPQIKPQWFIDVNRPAVEWNGKKMSLKQVMHDVVANGEITILPERFEKVYFSWIDNLHDWNISRQIWWGHRIPAWFKEGDSAEVVVSKDKPEDGSWQQDPDTLDTWFSSALWPWSTMIPPEIAMQDKYDLKQMLHKSPDYKKFHPTSVLETGYDIIFFWVARMVLMTTYVTGEVPFKTVYLHGLVRTKDGSKMSKSKPESIINPLDMIEKYGTDALRLSLLVGQSPGADMRIFDEKVMGYRNFCNKLWNISRYIEGRVGEDYQSVDKPKLQSTADHWIMDRLCDTIDRMGQHLDAHELGHAFELLYHFMWDEYADWYIEVSKLEYNQDVLIYVFETILKALHPFAPFITETIWETLQVHNKELLAITRWPKVDSADAKATAEFKQVKNIVSEVRNLRATLQLRDTNLYFSGSKLIEQNADLIQKLAGLKSVQQVEEGKGLHLTHTAIDAWLDVEENVLRDHLMQLIKRRRPVEDMLENLEKRLANEAYTRNAPKELVDETKQNYKDEKALLKRLEREIADIEASIKSYTTD